MFLGRKSKNILLGRWTTLRIVVQTRITTVGSVPSDIWAAAQSPVKRLSGGWKTAWREPRGANWWRITKAASVVVVWVSVLLKELIMNRNQAYITTWPNKDQHWYCAWRASVSISQTPWIRAVRALFNTWRVDGWHNLRRKPARIITQSNLNTHPPLLTLPDGFRCE